MTTAIGLIAYIAIVVGLAPHLLQRLSHSGLTPHLAITAWLVAIMGVIIAGISVVVLLLKTLWALLHHYSPVLSNCMKQIHNGIISASNSPLLLGFLLLSALIGLTIIGLCVRFLWLMAKMSRDTTDHAHQARLIGTTTQDADVILIEAHQAAAYAVAGKPSTIVLTSAADSILSHEQRAAVLAHERAHLAGKHALLVRLFKALGSVCPRSQLVTKASQNIALLLEMCADDAAARRYGSGAVVSGLLALCGITPAGTLGAATIGVTERVDRLVSKPTNIIHRSRLQLLAAISILALGPLLSVYLSHSIAHLLTTIFQCVC